MKKIIMIVLVAVALCYSCNQNTNKTGNVSPAANDSVAENTNTAEEDTALQEVLDLPLKR